MKRFNALLLAGLTTIGTVSAGVGVLHAATNPGAPNPMSSLVNAIAQRFNLNPSDVQQVFDQQRQQLEVQRQANQKTRLDQAVKNGKLTQAQEDLIVAKQQEVKTFMDGLKGKTPQEHHAAMQQEMQAVQQWAQTNNIPQQYIHLGPPRGHGGPRGGRGHGPGSESNGSGLQQNEGNGPPPDDGNGPPPAPQDSGSNTAPSAPNGS